MLETVRNWRRWSEIVIVRLPDHETGKITFVNMLSVSVFEWLVIRVGCKMYAKKEFDADRTQRFTGSIMDIIIQ